MTQALALPALTPASRWSQALQIKLMAAIDAIWAILEHSDDPAEIKAARDKAKAIGDLAAMARKVAQVVPAPRAKAAPSDEDAHARQDLDEPGRDFEGRVCPQPQPRTPAAPMAAQAEHARRALEKLKGGRRGRP